MLLLYFLRAVGSSNYSSMVLTCYNTCSSIALMAACVFHLAIRRLTGCRAATRD